MFSLSAEAFKIKPEVVTWFGCYGNSTFNWKYFWQSFLNMAKLKAFHTYRSPNDNWLSKKYAIQGFQSLLSATWRP